MDNITSNYYKCDEILKEFGEEKVAERWDTLYRELNDFLEYNKLSSVASVNKLLLGYAIVDYFQDVERIKEFHKIEKVNSQKIIAYTAYWLLKRKPIQIDNPQSEDQQSNITELDTLNERFVLQYIFNYLSERKKEQHVLLRPNNGLKNFSNMMLYYLEYRLRDAQSLELIIMSFLAGQIYERIDKDISSELHQNDH
jgi:hypothetical protein